MPSWDIAITSNGEQSYSNSSELSSAEAFFPSYAYAFPDYALLDGSFQNSPNALPSGYYGYISQAVSGEDGSFSDPPTITISYDRKKTSNGVLIVFNQASGDYCSEVQITWSKDGQEVKTSAFYPDSVRYFCQEKVPLFDTVTITFLRTLRPYRYVWVSYLQNRRMTDAGGLRIVYDDIALGAKENSSASSEDKESYVDLTGFNEVEEFPEYGFCYPDYALLDGSFLSSPEDISWGGYVSKTISGEDGAFLSPPAIEFSLSGGNYSSVGLTLTFNDFSRDYCSEINIIWYRDNEQISEKTFYPNSESFFCYNIVEYYNKVRIEFVKTSRPFRPAFLSSLDYGLNRVFDRTEITDISCIMEVDEISSEISANTLDFSIKSDVEYEFDFQKKQEIWLYFDELLMGKFFLSDGRQTSRWDYEMQAQDAVGIMDGFQFYGGIYNQFPIKDFLDGLFSGTGISYFLDDAYASETLTGYLPICTRREALQQLAFSIGAVVNTANNEVVQIYPKQEEVSSSFSSSDIFTGLSIEHSEIITGVRLYYHGYTQNEESTQIYKGVLDGESIVEFNDPYHSLSVSGGEIISSGDNYAVISGSGSEVILTGKKYTHSTSILEKKDDRITNFSNIAEVQEATLVNSQNAQAVLERIYDYYRNNETIAAKVILNEQEVGQMVQINTDFSGERTGTIRKMDFSFTNELVAEVEIG